MSISLCLQSCWPIYYNLTDATLYSEFGFDDMVEALNELSTVQTREYIEESKISSSFELNVECYEAYSVISQTQANVVINIAKQRRCGDITIPNLVHKIFLPEDLETESEVTEVLCETNGYLGSEIDSIAMEVEWDGEKPICPDDMLGDTVEAKYRRYSIGSDPSLKPEFDKWS